MRLSKGILLLLAALTLLALVPERALLPLRGRVLLAFCRPGRGGEEPPELRIRALEEEVTQLRAELGQREGGTDGPALGARIVYRGPTSWNHTLWIGAGEVDNRGHDTPRIAKGSPVVVGRALVGVVDYVGKRRSRVSLITDSRLHPAVQVAGGEVRVASLLSHLRVVESAIGLALQENVDLVKNHLRKLGSESYSLGKGELCGASQTLWRSHQTVLDGIGFEGEGVAVGDLLVTTGLDGVFPPGLEVGHVVEVERLHQGSPTYGLKALPASGELTGAASLFVLPPLPQ